MKFLSIILISSCNCCLLIYYLTSLVYFGYTIHGPSIAVLPFLILIISFFNGMLFFILQKKLFLWELANFALIAALLGYFLNPIWRFEMFHFLLIMIFSFTFGIKYLYIFLSFISNH